eukprot:Pgem_evm1s1702
MIQRVDPPPPGAYTKSDKNRPSSHIRKQKKDANDTTPTSAISNTITASTTTSSTTTGNTITTAISSAFPTDTCSSTNNQAEP